MHTKCSHEFSGIGHFEGAFSLKLKEGRKPCQTLLRCVESALQKPFKEELECLQQQHIIAPLGVDEAAECAITLCYCQS